MLMVYTLLPAQFSEAQEEAELYNVLQSATQTLDEVIHEATDGEFGLAYQLTSPEEFDRAFQDFQKAMQNGDLETLAKWFPNANELLSIVDATPGFEPYADWLRQRLDYAAVANQAVTTISLPKPAPESQPSSQSGTTAPETTIDASALVPPAQQSKQRMAFARNDDTWSKKLAGRPAVPAAAELVPPLKKIFSDQGVPAELVWIAEVESTFNPAARSPVGAVGLFQLMPNTAKHLGLQIEPEDQRLDPSKNGQAAARYLSDLYNRFEDWQLAIAAYNGGEGRVSKLLKANGATNLEGISDQLPSQTQMYVPKVLATIREREGFDPLSRW